VQAIQWQISAAASLGLPDHITCTYDIPDFEQYDTYPFAGFIHLATMLAAAELADIVGDANTSALARAAFNAGAAATAGLLWNATGGFYRGYTGGDAIMADCMYGQMVALHQGLGWLVPPANVTTHLAAEMRYNGNDGGFYLLSGRSNPGPMDAGGVAVATTQAPTTPRVAARARQTGGAGRLAAPFSTVDDVNWQGASATWSYLQLRLGALNASEALDPSRRSAENFRSRLRDWWNLAGITTSGDWGGENDNYQPYVTSHYGFLLPNYYLVPALTGQQVDLPAGQLNYTVAAPCPFDAPLLLAGTTGHVSCDAAGTYSVQLAFGALQLPAGGLVVNGVACTSSIDLQAGQCVSWA
jgi:hypothetical protein